MLVLNVGIITFSRFPISGSIQPMSRNQSAVSILYDDILAPMMHIVSGDIPVSVNIRLNCVPNRSTELLAERPRIRCFLSDSEELMWRPVQEAGVSSS